ncbi:MAG: hypothetical protein PWQ55_255 [Chloroflexota bacterium]|nr:hypothetical protein [Chloroflexota bacterium]
MKIYRIIMLCMALILLPGCSQAKAAGAQDSLAVYQDNLITEYDGIIDQMEGASRYQIDLTIPDSITDIDGHMTVQYTNNEKENLEVVYFRLFPNISGDILTVANLTVDGAEVPVVYEYGSTALRVDLPAALKPGRSTQIAMDFSQTVPTEMGGNYGLYIYLDDILALDQFFPIIPIYDEGGWEVGDPPKNADMIFMDESFFQVTVDAPEELVLAGSGIQQASSVKDGRQTVMYIGGPQRDFFLAGSPDFVMEQQQVGETTIRSFYPAEFSEAGEMVLDTAAHALESFGQRFGDYPYTELDVISTPMSAGGMEYSTAVTLSIAFYNPDYADGILAFLESAAAHEVGHQWFFNQVMSDQWEEPWLDEGLVQYATYLYYVDRYGPSRAQGVSASWYERWYRVGGSTIPIGKPAGEYSSDEYSSIVYGRGPLFFAALERQLGEEQFNTLLRDYTDQYRFGVASGADFKALAEETCACDLTPLFDEWVNE